MSDTTPTKDKTHDLFVRAALSDEDLGYPDDVSFIPSDEEWSDRALTRTIVDERRPAVVVFDSLEVLIEPCPRHGLRGLVDRMRGKTGVQIGFREHGIHAPSPVAVRTRVGRHPLDDIRRRPDPGRTPVPA